MFEKLPHDILLWIIVMLERSKYVANLYIVNRLLKAFIDSKKEKLIPLILRFVKTDDCEYYEFLNGVKHGLHVTRHKEGNQPRKECLYDHGAITMIRNFNYYEKIWIETSIGKNGAVHGKEIEYWWDSGKIRRISNYNNGAIHGDKISYHTDGTLECIAPYVNGKLHGDVKTYYRDGLIAVNRYVKGVCVEHTEYDTNGDVLISNKEK